MKKFTLLFFLLTVGILSMMADNITVDGLNRSYNVYAPNNLGENRPLLIFCHGYNQDANWMQNSEFKDNNVSMESVCDTAKFVVVFPNGIDKAWDTSGNRDINFIKAIIDKMVSQYNIDRNRVYLGGFSMGGMLTYHAMNKISDLIAAFCPVSGYPMGGATASADARAIPILHIHGTSDETCAFSGAQPALNVWINHNGCPTTAKVTNNYNGFTNCKMHVWSPGNDGSEVRLLELPNKGHWICKEPQVYTGKEIWNFCKRFKLNKTRPHVSISAPKPGLRYIYYAPEEMVSFPDINITATADDPNGTVEKVEFFDGDNLIATCTSKPYKATFTGGQKGKHTLTVVATDNDGETGSASVDVLFQAPTSLSLSAAFTEGGAVPVGWTTYDGKERRTGYSGGYSQGCRVLQLIGSPRGFDYGLYIRNVDGKTREGWAKFGLSDTSVKLTMAPGHYALTFKICNWNRADFPPVELNIEKRNGGTSVAKKSYTPTINIGNSTSNSFGNPKQQTFEFDITELDDYAIAIYTSDSSFADCMIGQLMLTNKSYDTVTGIKDIDKSNTNIPRFEKGVVYDMMGRRTSIPQSGLYIVDGKKYVK